MRLVRLSVLSLLVLGSSACVGDVPDVPHRLSGKGIYTDSGRPSDGLLHRADLQAVVELQIARDAQGLIARLNDSDPAVRARAAFGLASVIDRAALGPLERALDDEDAGVRRDAAFALGQMADVIAGPAAEALGVRLVERTRGEEDVAVLRQLFGSASRVGGDATLEALVALRPGPEVQADHALALGFLHRRDHESADSYALLTDYLESPDPEVRIHAAYAFQWTSDPRLWRDQLGRVRQLVAEWPLTEPALEMMGAGLESSELNDDHPAIIRLMRDGGNWRIRANAAKALRGWENPPWVRPSLFEALNDPSDHVGVAAANVIAISAPPPAYVQQMIDWVNGHPDETLIAAHLMRGIGPDQPEFLRSWLHAQALSDTRSWVIAIESLSEIGGPAVLELIATAATSDNDVLGLIATRNLASRFRAAPEYEMTRDFYHETFSRIAEIDDPDRRRTVASVLRHEAFADYPPVDVDVEPRPVIERPLEIDWERLADLGRHPRLVLETDRGRVVMTLDTEEAPLTTYWMTWFAEQGAFEGVPFHRVEQNFVIQGGDLSLGDHEPWQFRMQTEATLIPYRRGAVGMARSGRDTESTQLFVMHTIAPHLDGGYTGFGWVTEGMDVVDRIQRYDRILEAWVLPDPAS